MKIARLIDDSNAVCYGAVNPDADGCVTEAERLDDDIFAGVKRTGKTVGVKKLLAPVQPPNIIAIGLNYRDHAIESNMAVPLEPVIFLKATTSVTNPGDPIILPAEAPDEVDYEAELTVVIGKTARNIAPHEVDEYILGYTCGNDVSARDCQMKKDRQWARAKSFDTFCPLGPWMVTPDEFDPSDVRVRTSVEGEVLQDARTCEFIFPVDVLVSFVSRQFTLLAGTIIMTGTPAGAGFARTPPRSLRAGQQVTIDIEGIGKLVNPVKDAS